MKSKDGKCPICHKDDSKIKGTLGMTLYSECLICGYIFWEDVTEITGPPLPELINTEEDARGTIIEGV